ncbi:MAG: RodZ domain-containing protein [Pseudomonadota bacterium]
MMAKNRSIDEPEVQTLVSRGPGEVLKTARMRAKITLEQVSEYLHLPLDVIAAIEADAQEGLPGATYVKGYIRSYARYLDLESDPLVEGYIKYIQPGPEPIQATETRRSSHPGTEHHSKPAHQVAIVLLSIILVFLVIWWFYPQPTKFMGKLQSLFFNIGGDQIVPSVLEPRTIPEQRPDNPILEPSQPGERRSETSVSAFTELSRIGAGGMDDAQPAEIEEQPISELPKQNSLDGVAAEADQEDLIAKTLPATSPQVEGIDTQGREAPGTDRLKLSFRDHSWTEVYDVNKEKLLFGLMNSGSIKELRGTAPFRILLGNSTAVNIQFNDEPFDHSQFERWDKTARFNIGDTAAN